jgi:hypothetical protein
MVHDHDSCQCPEITTIDDFQTHKTCQLTPKFYEDGVRIQAGPRQGTHKFEREARRQKFEREVRRIEGDIRKSLQGPSEILGPLPTSDGWRPTPYIEPPRPHWSQRPIGTGVSITAAIGTTIGGLWIMPTSIGLGIFASVIGLLGLTLGLGRLGDTLAARQRSAGHSNHIHTPPPATWLPSPKPTRKPVAKVERKGWEFSIVFRIGPR